MEDSYYGRRAVGPFEPKRDKEKHANQRRDRYGDRLIAQLLTRNLAYGVGAFDLVRCIGIIGKRLGSCRFRPERTQRLVDLGTRCINPDLILLRIRCLESLVRHLDEELARLIKNRLNRRVVNACVMNRRTDSLSRRRLPESRSEERRVGKECRLGWARY